MATSIPSNVIVLSERRFDSSREHITHVAIIIREGNDRGLYTSPKPQRHGGLMQEMIEDWGCEPPVVGEEGFLTSAGRFVNRKEALVLARAAGQLRRRKQPGDYDGDELFSEDVW